MIPNYIQPITRVHSTFDEAKKFVDESGGISWFEPDQVLTAEALVQAKRNLVVGEPGVGKSLLLQNINEYLASTNVVTRLVSLRQPDALRQIEDFLGKDSNGRRALLLDALDEAKASDIPATIQYIGQLVASYPDLQVFLSSRWVFIGHYSRHFPEFRFITISPFTIAQVRSYLLLGGHSASDVDVLLGRVMSFGHQMLVLQIPRYLSYLDAFLKKEGLDAASKVSRNDLFEYFIYSKLKLEDDKQPANKSVLIKRVLEKLALTMEIYQTNVVSTDELMTFFDEVESDLKRVAFAQIDVEEFYNYSLLKVGREDLEKVGFDNAEFQEYLAAKEIMRLPEPSRAAFSFAADPQLNEIYPTWYNALTFLVDMEPSLLGQLVDFSGLRADEFRVLDETFLTFLTRVDPRRIPSELRQELFRDVIAYHERTLQWVSFGLSEAMAALYEPPLETYLKDRALSAESSTGTARLVRLANVAYTVGCLLKAGVTLDRPYWRRALLNYAADQNENGVLQRHALVAIQYFGDATALDELPDFRDAEELVLREYLDTCAALDPDHSRSVRSFFDAVRKGEIHGRYGLYALKARQSIKTFLETFVRDDEFRHKFMDGTSIFNDKDQALVDKSEALFDRSIREWSTRVLLASLHYDLAHDAERSVFINGLWRALRKNNRRFVARMVKRIVDDSDDGQRLFLANHFFAQVIEREDVAPYITAVKATKETFSAFRVMLAIKFSGREGAEEIYEAGRRLLKKEYRDWERAQAARKPDPHDEPAKKLLGEFRTLLEPEPGKYMQHVFRFYNEHADDLDPLLEPEDRERMEDLCRNSVFKFVDPSKHGVAITQEQGGSKSYSLSAAVHIFGEALVAATRLGFDVASYRTKVLSLIPFAHSEHLKAIFDAVKTVKSGELDHVIEVYRTRHSDLWRHNPSSFVEAVEQYHVTEAGPVLKAFIFEQAWEPHARREALRVLDSIAPNADSLREVFERYRDSQDRTEQDLATIANGLLITAHVDPSAIDWRLREISQRAAAFVRPKGPGAHNVSPFEDEITSSKTFARPLMQLKDPAYEARYLAILDQALNLWATGPEFYQYATYLWDVVYAYFDNLKENRSYRPLEVVEAVVASMKNREGANWLASRMANLRRSYLAYLGKPATIGKAIAKYNDARKYNDKEVRNSADLFRDLQDALETDVRRWIEGEGAYDVLRYKIARSGRQQYETLIQKTLKAQIENVLLKRGFQVEVLRESQLLDDKRTDFLVRYGFAGPIVIEVKLASNKDIKGARIDDSASYKSMERYMQGYGASYGIFMIVDNIGAKNLGAVAQTFQRIQGVSVLAFNCHGDAERRKPRRKRATRKGAKKRRAPARAR